MASKFVTLALPPGVVRSGTAYASKGRWYDSSLVRFVNGIIRPVGGWSLVRTSAMLNPWLVRFAPGFSAVRLYNLQVFARQSAHFAEYAILFLFLNFGPLRGRRCATRGS